VIVSSILPSDVLDTGPLHGTVLPSSLEDVSLQMTQIADDGADIALCHVEADRLLLLALDILSRTAKLEDAAAISEITAQFNRIKKIYE
jgi:hypothetical protein